MIKKTKFISCLAWVIRRRVYTNLYFYVITCERNWELHKDRHDEIIRVLFLPFGFGTLKIDQKVDIITWSK